MLEKLSSIGAHFIKIFTKELDIQDGFMEPAENYRYVPRDFGNINDYQYINQFLDGKYSNSNTTKHLILYGDTGLGKTEIAKYYLYENKRKDIYGEMIWFDCEHENLVKQMYKNIASTLSIPTTANIAKEVLLKLVEKANNCNKRILLIFDNVKNLSLLLRNELIPKFGNFDVLITTQVLETINDIHPIKQEIKKMNEDQVKRLIKEYLKIQILDDEDLKKFYELSHGIPVDIVEACDYIINNRSSLKEFIEWHTHKQFTSFDKEIFKSTFQIKYERWKNLVNALDVRSRDLLARICFFPDDIKNEWLYDIYSDDYLLIKGNLSKLYFISESETKRGYITIDKHLKKYLIDNLFVSNRQKHVEMTLDLLSSLHKNLLKNGYLKQDLYEILTLGYALLNELSDNEFKKYRKIYFPLFISCLLDAFDIHNLDSYYKFLTRLDMSTENKRIHEKLIIKCLIADYKRINQRNIEEKNKQNNKLLIEAKKEFSTIRLSILKNLHNHDTTRLSIIFYFLRGITYIDDAEFDKGLTDLTYAFKQIKGQNNVPECIILKAKFYMALALIRIPTIDLENIKIYIDDFSIRLNNINNNQKDVFEFACLSYLISILYLKLSDIEQSKKFYLIFVSNLKETRGFFFERLTKQIKLPNTIEELLNQDAKSSENCSHPITLENRIMENVQQIVPTVSNSNIIKNPALEARQNAQRDRLHNEEMVKQKLVQRIPSHYQLGAAIGQGDCFFDAMAQSLNVLKGSNGYTAESLRLLCDDYVKSGKYTWVKETIEAEGDNYEQYLVRIPFTVAELEEEEKANSGLKLEDIVWGRPEIEGRMICEIVKVKLHIIGVLEEAINGMDVVEQLVDVQASEPITPIEKGQYDSSDIVHLVNYHNHFVPLLDSKLSQAEKSLTQFSEHSRIMSKQRQALVLQEKQNMAPANSGLTKPLVNSKEVARSSNQARDNKCLINFTSKDAVMLPLKEEELKKYLKVSDKSKYTNITYALKYLHLFKIDTSGKQNLWQKPITDISEKNCKFLHKLASVFFTLVADEIVLDKYIYDCLDDEQKLLFAFAQLWFPEHAVLFNNILILKKLLQYQQAIGFKPCKLDALLSIALSFSLSPKIKSDRDNIVILLLNAGARLNNENANLFSTDNMFHPIIDANEIENLKLLSLSHNAKYQVHLPIPTRLIWNNRNTLIPLINDITLRFYKNGYFPSSQFYQTPADIYIIAFFNHTEALDDLIKVEMFKELEKKISKALKLKVCIVDDSNNSDLSKAAEESFSFDEILQFGKAQEELWNQTKQIIAENKLDILANSIELENTPSVSFIKQLTHNQVLGFIKLGILYEAINGILYLDYDQDRVFYLLNEEQRKLVKHARYWNLHLCMQYFVDNDSLFFMAELILKASKAKEVERDINVLDSHDFTCLERALKVTQGVVSKTGLHTRINGKLCLLLLKYGAKTRPMDELLFSFAKLEDSLHSTSKNIPSLNQKMIASIFQNSVKRENSNQQNSKGALAMAESKINQEVNHIDNNKLPLLIKEDLLVKGNNVNVFRFLTSQGYTWRSLLNNHVFDTTLTSEARQNSEDIVKELIKKRDQLDKDMYRLAVESLMGDKDKSLYEQRYQYNRKPDNTGPKNDLTGYKLEYYVLEVCDKQQNDKLLFTINIKAPGSRDLTSDIDTTVEVTCHQEDLITHLNWPEELGKLNLNEVDLELIIQAGIVYHFNQVNCELIGQTSAESRDSNVYIDGFMHTLSFLKFEDWVDEKHGSAIQLIKKQAKDKFYQSQKHRRQVLELAASLFPFRVYYGNKAEEFNHQLMNFFAIHQLDMNQAFFDTHMKEILAQTEKLYQYQQGQIANFKNNDGIKKAYLSLCRKNLDKNKVSLTQASLDNERAEDFDAYVNNLLYAKHLLEVAKIRKKINAINIELNKQNIESASTKLNNLDKSINNLNEKLKAEKDDDIRSAITQKLETDKDKRTKYYKEEFESSLKAYVTQLEALAKLHIQHQEALINAQLFALEAYTNYSAPYHIVKWQQSGDTSVRIDRARVALCSALQQIGFQLSHAKHYQTLGMDQGQILYRVAKYGQRAADVFFGDTETWFGDAEHSYNAHDIILQRFKSTITANVFGKQLYDFLNLQVALIKEIKKNEDIPVHEKGHQAMLLCLKRYRKEYINKPIDNEDDDILVTILKKEKSGVDTWLRTKGIVLIDSLGNLIVKAYQAKTDRYSSNVEKQRLCWGTLFNVTGNNQQKSQAHTKAEANNTNQESPAKK